MTTLEQILLQANSQALQHLHRSNEVTQSQCPYIQEAINALSYAAKEVGCHLAYREKQKAKAKKQKVRQP